MNFYMKKIINDMFIIKGFIVKGSNPWF